jgi:carboxypeptidase C (cathepsin A)
MKGATLSGDERKRTVEQLARFTGLTPEYVERTNLRINIHRFCKELLRDQRRTVGRLDSRFTGVDRDAAGEQYEYDPSSALILGAYATTLNDYLRTELRFESELAYVTMSNLWEHWDYSKHQNQFVNVAETLRSAMTKNPFLRVFVASGLFDLATPYVAAWYTFNHLEIDPELQGNISMESYEAGHMMYIHEPSLAKAKADIATFIESSIG